MRYSSIVHHGAVTGVTGSCHPLHMDDEHGLPIGRGLFQGAKTSPTGRAGAGSLALEVSLDDLKALVVTHADIDHVGRIPYLLAAGFTGPILCGGPSAKLLPIVLEKAFRLGFSRGRKQVERYLKLIEQRMVSLMETAQLVIAIAGNGMCSSGRIVNYLKTMLGDERHDVLLVGCQADGATGRQNQRFGPCGGYVEFDGQRYEICAQVHTIGGYSTLADQNGPVSFVARRMKRGPSEVCVVQGEL